MPKTKMSIQRRTVHVWKVPLPLSEVMCALLKKCLSPEERERSGKLRFAQDQLMYIGARGALRTILGSYLNERPSDLKFGYGPFGKPFLSNPTAHTIEFNLSHCRDMAVIGVASRRRIGIDIEVIRDLPEQEDIIELHFGSEERAFVRSAGEEAKTARFYRIWTRREATAKARGLNLFAAMSDLEIPIYPSGSGARLGQKGECSWSLLDLQLDPAFIGAVCVEGDTRNVAYRDFADLLSGIDH